MRQPEPEARDIALAAELITEGSLNVFAHPSNVDMNRRIISLDLYEMGEQLRPTALVVTLEAIQNRVIANRKRGKYTWVFIDEVYLYFKYHYSAEILYRAWKRFRKYGGILTAATQNVEECLKSETARLMFANSEFLMLYNQAATDRQELAKLLRISDAQMGYITDAEPGHGLLRMGNALVPFTNTIPKDTDLYRLMNTSPGMA
jgi:type IV secretory pathway VirB4 component